jgi:hypothetical protein
MSKKISENLPSKMPCILPTIVIKIITITEEITIQKMKKIISQMKKYLKLRLNPHPKNPMIKKKKIKMMKNIMSLKKIYLMKELLQVNLKREFKK